MAQAQRVYRDYSLDDEQSWSRPASKTPPSTDRTDSPQTVILDAMESETRKPPVRVRYQPSNRLEYGIEKLTERNIGVPRDPGPLHPGYGNARTTDDSYIDDSSSDASYGEPIEPTLEFNQVEAPQTPKSNGSTAAPSPNVPRIANDKRPMSPISESGTVQAATSKADSIHQSRSESRDSMEDKMPEFFSLSVFRAALYNPTISHHLFKFGQLRLCSENMDFLQRAHQFQNMVNELSKTVMEMHEEFISSSARSQINVADKVQAKTTQAVTAAMGSTMSSPLVQLSNIFGYAQTEIENLVYSDVYPKFVRHQMTLSAAKALGGNRSQYAGLGDCFVLTDPSKADNPIVFASDGFVKVTGFSRKEIIPRNCRFLQGRSTHQTSVKRLRKKIQKKEESVELLLNYKKSGEPFWNLLYTAPLFDTRGNLIFFLGGQINCSTTINSSSDVLRILSQTKEPNEGRTPSIQSARAAKPPPGRRLLNAFRNNSSTIVEPRPPGMEDKILDQIESLPLNKQADAFYSAYSNYVIINYSTYLISFISSGLLEILFPIKTAKTGHATNTAVHSSTNYSTAVQMMPIASAVGTDIFKFLTNHGTGSLSWEFKSTVKTALKAGIPVSLDMKLCARPYMGFEKFLLHWTPLKGEHGEVQWIVLTLGNQGRAR